MTKNEFEELINNQKDKLFRFAFSILGNHEDSRDAVQEVVFSLWKNRRSLDASKKPESYCLSAIRNHCFDEIRKQKQTNNYRQTLTNGFIEESVVEQADLIEKLKGELHRLPEQQRLAIELKDFQGMEYEEMSEILEQSIDAIRANVSRGRKKLFNIFKEELKHV